MLKNGRKSIRNDMSNTIINSRSLTHENLLNPIANFIDPSNNLSFY